MDSEFEHCGSTNREQHFIVEDLLDFSNDDGVVFEDDGNITSCNSDSNYSNNNNLCDSNNASGGGDGLVVTPPGSGNSSSSGNNNDVVFPSGGGESGLSEANFSGELCVPYDDLAELEWLSNFVEESFSSEDLQKSHLVSGMATSATKTRPELTGSSEARYYTSEPLRPEPHQNPTFVPEMPVPGKARSKRSRAAPGNWTSRLKVLSNGPGPGPRPEKPPSKKKCGPGARSGHSELSDGEVRRCLHCATDKTPQWRTGPMGPKTLCNACGVRYKSGRLVPEYRPAASPTFVQTKHSNSHRKVMELRRQKEVMNQQQQRQQQQYIQQQQQHYHQQQQQLIRHSHSSMMFDPTNNPEDYLIHQHIGPDYRQLA